MNDLSAGIAPESASDMGNHGDGPTRFRWSRPHACCEGEEGRRKMGPESWAGGGCLGRQGLSCTDRQMSQVEDWQQGRGTVICPCTSPRLTTPFLVHQTFTESTPGPALGIQRLLKVLIQPSRVAREGKALRQHAQGRARPGRLPGSGGGPAESIKERQTEGHQQAGGWAWGGVGDLTEGGFPHPQLERCGNE